jgi:hypothetical protein
MTALLTVIGIIVLAGLVNAAFWLLMILAKLKGDRHG